MKNCLECHVWGCPLATLKGGPQGLLLASEDVALVWKISLRHSKHTKGVTPLSASLFSFKVGLTLSQIAKENKIDEMPYGSASFTSKSYLVLPPGGAHKRRWRGPVREDDSQVTAMNTAWYI